MELPDLGHHISRRWTDQDLVINLNYEPNSRAPG